MTKKEALTFLLLQLFATLMLVYTNAVLAKEGLRFAWIIGILVSMITAGTFGYLLSLYLSKK